MTDSDTFQVIPDYSSLELMALSNQFRAILSLGNKLVEELGGETKVDTLSRWMANHIARLISDVDAARETDRPQKERECFEAILALWTHRTDLPNGKRPFEDYEALFRTIRSLDPEEQYPRYFRIISKDEQEENEELKQNRWLNLANRIDEAAKTLTKYCLSMASEEVSEGSAEWRTLTEALSSTSDDQVVVNLIFQEPDLLKELDINSLAADELERQKNAINLLLKASELFLEHIEAKLLNLKGRDPGIAEPPH